MPITKLPPLDHNHIPAITNSKHRSNTSHKRSISARDIDSSSTIRDSSLQKVWDQDYYATEGGTHIAQGAIQEGFNIPSPPAAAALTNRPYPRSVPLDEEEESFPARQTRTHQRSLTALLPFSNTISRSPERSPTKVDIEDDFMATLTGDKEGVIKVADRRGGLSSWFSGSSAPMTVGVPIMDQEHTSTTSSRDISPERPSVKLQKRPTVDGPTTPQKTNTGIFSMFSSPKPKPQKVQIPADLNNDDLLTVDITAALFPHGELSANDPFSPAAFKNLLMNAEGLLLKLQTAYKNRTISFYELRDDNDVMDEELEEAETRAKMYKSQLEEMATRVASQDLVMAELAAELATEKQARAEEKMAREQSISMVKGGVDRDTHKRGGNLSIDTTGEDLGISSANGRRKRVSGGSGYSLATDGDSDSDSDIIFSRSRSPAYTMSSVSVADTVASTPEIMQASVARVVPNPAQNTTRPKLTQQRSTFQKILSGMSALSTEDGQVDPYEGIGMGEEGCSNCRGKDASVAWDTVGLLRAENKGLKERVGSLEGAVEGALDMCNGTK